MKKTIFDYVNYKEYLEAYIQGQPGRGRGLRARMADCMGCQRGFVTRVLSPKSSADFSLEQADRLNTLLAHSAEECNFFLLQVQYSRAGTDRLREHFLSQMKLILNRRLQASKSADSRFNFSPEDHMKYYGYWYYAAIRIATSIPKLQTREAVSRHFNLPPTTVAQVLEFLLSRGLVTRKGDRFHYASQRQVHLPADHPMIPSYHAGWRGRAVQSLEVERAKDLHYSYAVAISEEDALRIRSFLVETIQELLRRTAPSKEESIYSFCLDFFEV